MSIELINPKPLHTINALSTPCLEPYHSLYCLNGGQCFNVSLCPAYIVSCECATGFWGERCEWKYLDQSYNPKHYIELDDISASQNRSEVGEPDGKLCCVVVIQLTNLLYYKLTSTLFHVNSALRVSNFYLRLSGQLSLSRGD